MTLVPLMVLLLVVGGTAGDVEPAALVARLGSARFAEREEASKALEQRGSEALPALRAARESKDPEVRTRAMTLLEKIETGLMVRPALVRLEYRDRPVPEVVKALADQTGIAMALLPENDPALQARRITLEAPAPVPFWTALDRLCRDGKLQSNTVAQAFGAAARGTIVQLTAGSGVLSPYVSDNGPFRALLLGIHHHRDLGLGQAALAQGFGLVPGGLPPPPPGGLVPAPPRNPAIADSFYVELQVMAEPRMVLSHHGALTLTEAIDDKGQSLLPATSGTILPRQPNYFGFNVGSTAIQMRAELKYPEQPGRWIKHLRGKVPVVVSARKDEPLTISLAESKGKTFRNAAFNLVIHEVKVDPTQAHTTIDLSVRPNAAPTDPSGVAGRFGPELMAFRSPNMPQSQIEILDAQGRAYQHWFPSSTRIDNDEARMTLALMPNENLGQPARIRFYDMVRASSEVTFDFTDVPMP